MSDTSETGSAAMVVDAEDEDLWRLERAKDSALRAYRNSAAADTTEGPEWDAFVDAAVALGIETVHRDAIREGPA